ncbi:hypothetical protein PRUPE_6G174200 [Prunus persica]|uniref:Uncharacterized protein n=1 Tax=Prunus persica TaxID=3760 RepID=A0A251NRV7_PRUPE|nr:hypothetical protein PRUPE_6G174200 [Prunus persica]
MGEQNTHKRGEQKHPQRRGENEQRISTRKSTSSKEQAREEKPEERGEGENLLPHPIPLPLPKGKCCSQSVSSTGLGVAMRNRIYFSNDHAAPWWNEWDSDHLYGISARLNLNNVGRKDWACSALAMELMRIFTFVAIETDGDRFG